MTINKYLFYGMTLAIIGLSVALFYLLHQKASLADDMLIREGKVIELKKQIAVSDSSIFVMKHSIDSLYKEILKTDNSKTKITNKYEKAKNSVLLLSADSSIIVLSNRLKSISAENYH